MAEGASLVLSTFVTPAYSLSDDFPSQVPALPLPPIIFDEFSSSKVTPEQMDMLWARGWRHFGSRFFQNSLHLQQNRWLLIVPLRVRLDAFVPSKSQRRILRKNEDLKCTFEPAAMTEELEAMFLKHKSRFSENVPSSLRDFLGENLQHYPCDCRLLRCTLEGQTIAASFIDMGAFGVSSVYGIFDPDYSGRSLGIFTMLKEIEYARAEGRFFYYPGYATHEPSRYDYKKQFSGLEGMDWIKWEWSPLPV